MQQTIEGMIEIAARHHDAILTALGVWCKEHAELWKEAVVPSDHEIGFWSDDFLPRAGDASWDAEKRDAFVAAWSKLLRFCEAGWFGSTVAGYDDYADFRVPEGATKEQLEAFNGPLSQSGGAILGDADVHLVLPKTNFHELGVDHLRAFVTSRIGDEMDMRNTETTMHIRMPSGLVAYVSWFDVSLPAWFVHLVIALDPLLDSPAVSGATAWSLENAEFVAEIHKERRIQRLQRVISGMQDISWSN